MGTWIDILKLGAEGDAQAARDLLYGQVRVELLMSPTDRSGTYNGLVPKAVANFVSKLPEEERGDARFHQDDLVDYIMDDVITGMEKPLLLVELCYARPASTLDELVTTYPWEEGLKRSPEWKRQWIADVLKSLPEAGVSLPPSIIATLGDEGEAKYEFNEIKYALKSQRLEWSWNDFKKKANLENEFLCLVDSETEEGVGAEAVSFGTITVAEIMRRLRPEYNHETTLALVFLGRELSLEITTLVEDMHAAKPGDGCKPIAWHNIFWYVCSEYERLQLDLEMREPYHEEDEKLAAHIAANYREVTGTSRSTIRRRRMAIRDACEGQIHTRLKEKLV